MIKVLKRKDWLFLLLIFVMFLCLRIPGTHIPYHQDEYKWVMYAHPEILPPGTVPHPPLTEFIYTKFGPIFGDNNFRFIPLVFSSMNFFLLALLAYEIFKDKRAVLVSLFLYSILFFSILSSLMVDVDGAIMPFFFLVLSIGYFKFRNSNWNDKKWLILVVLGAIGGFFIKISAILPMVAYGIDYAIEQKVFENKKRVLKYIGYSVLVGVSLVLLLFLSKLIFPFFRLEYSFGYWGHFVSIRNFLNRGWLQIFIQVVKTVLYISPLLLSLFFIDKDTIKKTKPLFVFIICALVFYLVLFDFSIGALDRYMEFLVVPLVLVFGSILSKTFNSEERFSTIKILLTVFVLGIVFYAQYLTQYVPALYPKTEWINRIFSLKWNFLYPFFGGSGPFPFYVSFLFIGLSWVVSSVILAISFVKKDQKTALLFILICSFLYNGVFTEEYLFGKINGNSKAVAQELFEYVRDTKDVEMVTVYNDNGGWDIQAMGKYRKRLYIDPKFDVIEKVKTLNKYKEHYMVLDIPHIDPNTVYAKYFSSCRLDYESTSKYISGYIYDCRKAPDLKI